jgi:hypothetical protein
MKSINNTTTRAVVAMGTVVALIASVGAPFKWSMIVPPWLKV